jgi:hypothetical protein
MAFATQNEGTSAALPRDRSAVYLDPKWILHILARQFELAPMSGQMPDAPLSTLRDAAAEAAPSLGQVSDALSRAGQYLDLLDERLQEIQDDDLRSKLRKKADAYRAMYDRLVPARESIDAAVRAVRQERAGAEQRVQDALEPADAGEAREVRAVLRKMNDKDRAAAVARFKKVRDWESIRAIVSRDFAMSRVREDTHRYLRKELVQGVAEQDARRAEVLEKTEELLERPVRHFGSIAERYLATADRGAVTQIVREHFPGDRQLNQAVSRNWEPEVRSMVVSGVDE